MKVPLFVNFFFTKMNDLCMIIYESMHEACPHVFFHILHCMKLISIDPQFVVIFRFMESFCFVFFFPLKNIPWSDQFIEKLFSLPLFFESYLSDIHEIAKVLGRA